MPVVFVSIGNSDNKLTQAEWNQYCLEVETYCDHLSTRFYAKCYSLSNAPFQNAVFSMECPATTISSLRSCLSMAANKYRQDSIAMNVCDSTDMVSPAKPTVTFDSVKPGTHPRDCNCDVCVAEEEKCPHGYSKGDQHWYGCVGVDPVTGEKTK